MNPFTLKPEAIDTGFENWNELYPVSYNKYEVDPFTRLRVILMNGTEFEATWFSHQFHRHTDNNDLRRQLALLRRVEQQQQKKIACLKPMDENVLEHTIGYEQLAVELTAILAQREPDEYVKMALDFALLEDFDHLYRYGDLLEMEQGVLAERLVGCYTEIMPARPTIAHHRYPFDSVKYPVDFKTAAPITKLNVGIITAAEQQTMNYYMNNAGFHPTELGRRLYQEIAMIEEQHVSHYGSLLDPRCTWLESLVMHEYTECYLYYSCYEDETDPAIKAIWERCFAQEVAHLHAAAGLLAQYEGKHWQQVIPEGEFPELLCFRGNKEYVRQVLANTVHLTADMENYSPICDLPDNARFFFYQQTVNPEVCMVASHKVIEASIQKNGQDYRYEDCPNPIEALRCRTADNTCVGRSCMKE